MNGAGKDSPAFEAEAPDGKTGATRRRGKVLEDAILQAAWDELQETGYTHLTMESVAARAKTNKAVVYRRWENKATLVAMALQKYVMPMIPKAVPDTGSLRDDVFEALSGLAAPLRLIGAETIYGLMADMLGRAMTALLQREKPADGESIIYERMMAILKNAEKRGELDTASIPRRVVTLPLDLFRFELFVRRGPVSEDALREIVDNIFMPAIGRFMG